MKEKIKAFLLGSILTGLLFTAVISVSGAGSSFSKTAQLIFDNIKICVDGEFIQPTDASGNAVEPFIIDGTTYLPVRAVASALDKEVSWDGSTKTVYLGQKPGDGTFSSPINMNVAKTVPVLNENYSATIKVLDVIRGEEAFRMAEETDEIYLGIDNDYECMFIKLSVDASSNYNSASVVNPMGYWNFKFADNAQVSDYLSPCDFEGSLIDKLTSQYYEGEEVEGYICLAEEYLPENLKFAFSTSYIGEFGCWFSLTE